MTTKNIGMNCHDCEGSYAVTENRAKRSECPNCHSANVLILDELPEC